MKNRILVTGGAGYIGSHTVKKLVARGYKILVLDDLSYGKRELVEGVELVVGDIADEKVLDKILKEFKPEALIHFAAFKDAAESVYLPNKYFYNNTAKSITLFNKLIEANVKNIIFSSTAAVYGEVHEFPITEEFTIQPVNPYGLSKAMIESVLFEYEKAFDVKPVIFRYFNVAGADPEGDLGNMYPEPKDVISVLMKSALNHTPFGICGTDYDTVDGSPVRDLIHVDDLAEAHVLGLEKLLSEGKTGIFNLGSENGYSVLEMARMTKEITGSDFEIVNDPRRPGDIVVSIASSEKAQRELGWKAKFGLKEILSTAWAWQIKMGESDEKAKRNS